MDNPRFAKAIQKELTDNYDNIDLSKNYGILVIPGYLGSNKVVEKWAKLAYENKVMLITDFANLDSPDDVMQLFDEANLTGADVYRSNIIMTCNWLVGRGVLFEAGEQENLMISAAAALAGSIYRTLMSQPAAGKKYGSINEVDGVKFKLKKSEIAHLVKLGLIPMVKEYGKVMAFGASTLFTGANLGLQTYSVVRVFDWIAKVLMDFLNRVVFQNFNAQTRKELNEQIVKFLDGITGPGKLIENFSIQRFEQDLVQKDVVHLSIHLKPFFATRVFEIELTGHAGDNANKYDSKVTQQ